MRLLLVTGEYPPDGGGIADYTSLLRAALEDVGVDVAVAAPRPSTDGNVVTIDNWGPSAAVTLSRMIREMAVDVVHLQYQAGAYSMRPTVNLMPGIVALGTAALVVTTFHDLRPPYLFPKAGRLRRATIAHMARSSAAVVATNPADHRALSALGVAATEIPIGSNLPQVTTKARVSPNTVGFFGLPTRSKGVIELLDALARLPQDRRPTLRLIGDHGSVSTYNDVVAGAEIDRAALFRGVHIEATGRLDRTAAAEALRTCAAIALPFVDGASLRSGSLLAALESGRPVVTTAPTDLDDIAPIARLAQLHLVPPSDTTALANAIDAALRCDDNVDRLPSQFSWPSIALQHVALYRALLDAHRR